jgi:hypothetical protein
MSWRDKLQIAYLESRDKSDRSPTFVTSVTGFGNPTDELSADVVLPPDQSPVTTEADRGIPWAEWKAEALNRLFREQGIIGQPGRITAATIRHGESVRERVDSVATPERPMSRAEATE